MSATAPSARSKYLRARAVPLDAELAAVLTVAALTVAALVLRWTQIHQSLLGDEVFTYQDIHGRSFRAVLTTVHAGGENSPPLFFLMSWFTAKLGDPTVWLRLPSVLLGTATVPMIYLLGRDTLGRIPGVIAAAVMALTPFAVFYGIEARPYASMMFFVTVSTLALLHAVRTGSRWWWLTYALAATAAAYTHYTSIFALGVQALWSLWICRQRVRPALAFNVLIIVLYAPWLPQLRGKALAVIGALYPLGFHRVVTDLLRPIPGHPSAFLRQIPTIPGLIVIGAPALAGLVFVLANTWRSSRTSDRWRPSPAVILVIILALATPVGLLLYSLTVTDLWLPRGLSASMPATALVLGGLLAALPRPVTALAVLAMIVTMVAGTIRSFGPAYNRGPYREIDAYIDRVGAPRDPVLIATYVGSLPVRYQFHKPHIIQSARASVAWVPVGARMYLVFDEVLARVARLSVPHPQGFKLVAVRHYGGAQSTDLITYKRLSR